MYNLRPDQLSIINQVRDSFMQGNRATLVCAATGFGKTIVASHMMKLAASNGKKILFLVTYTVLIEQTCEKLDALGIDYQIGVNDYGNDNIFICSLQTLANHPEWLEHKWDLALFDECHTSAWYGMANEVFKVAKNIIGLTATPYRLSLYEFMADKFDDCVISPSMGELIQQGSLCPLKYYDIDLNLDFANVKVMGGDYQQSGLSAIMSDEKVIHDVLNHLEKIAPNKRTLAFAASVSHAKEICRIAEQRSIPSAYVVGSTSKADRNKIFAQMESGSIMLIASCMALSTGFDMPCAEVGLLLRKSKSHSLIIQQIGRLARVFSNKDYGIIIDPVGNLYELGDTPCGIVHTKESIMARVLREPKEPPIKTCPVCYAINRASAKSCEVCGHVFEKTFKEARQKPTLGNSALHISASMVRKINTPEVHKLYYRRLIRKAYEDMDRPTTPYRVYCEKKFKLYPKPQKGWGLGAIFEGNTKYLSAHFQRIQRWAYTLGDPSKIGWLMSEEWGKNWEKLKDN